MKGFDLEKLEKGQKVKVTGNEIFTMMGYAVVTGTVFNKNPNGNSFSIKCNETGAIELVSLDDGGEIEVL